MSRRPRFADGDGGATLVEFALVAPVLILALIVTFDFARALNAYVTVANASREGARFGTLNPSADPAAIRDDVARRVAPLGTDPSVLTVTATYDTSDGAGFRPWTAGGIPRDVAAAAIEIRVDVSYSWQASTWVGGSLFSATGSRTFASSSTMETVW